MPRGDTRVLKVWFCFIYLVYVLANTDRVVKNNNKLFTKLFELKIYEVGFRLAVCKDNVIRRIIFFMAERIRSLVFRSIGMQYNFWTYRDEVR